MACEIFEHLQHVGSFINSLAIELLVAECGMWFPQQGLNLGLHWGTWSLNHWDLEIPLLFSALDICSGSLVAVYILFKIV